MGVYNTLELITLCPRCEVVSPVEVEFRFGLVNLDTYRLGDDLRWIGVGHSQPHSRPPNGDFDGEGYAECLACHKDFWMMIYVRKDVIASATVDHTKMGYIH